MRKSIVAGALIAIACAAARTEDRPILDKTPAPENPLLAKWTGPYGGHPAFGQVKVDLFKPAMAAAMDAYRHEIDLIANSKDAPNFENTIAALEDAGRTYQNVLTYFSVWSSNMKGTDFKAVERHLAPKIAAFDDELYQNEKLFRRIEAVYDSPEKAKLTPEQQRLTWLRYTNFVRSGARLDADAKKRLAELNQRLATLFTEFSQNVLADEEGYATVLESEADLAGLPDSVRSSAAADAEAAGKKGKWLIANTRSAVEPFLAFSSRRDLREKVWRNFISRGDNGDAHDNKKIVSEILRLRAQRAKLLGYPTHAHWRLENTMARTPERAMELMEAVWKPAVVRAREEVADMQAIADREGARIKIAPWDYRYYAEKVRKAKYDLDENEVKPYLQLDKMREGMFWVAGELLGLSFTPVDVPAYHPDVRVWEVKDKATGKHVGLWYFDPYARPGKRSGAWMSEYRPQERFRGDVPAIVSNNSNFVKGRPGEPVLIGWGDAETLFHEFGHALHGLSSSVSYPSLSGTSVARDYVEFPSQLLEQWIQTPEVLNRFALHYQTGEPLPAALVAKLLRAAKFNQGFGTVEYLAAALVDMKIHLAGDVEIDPAKFEKETLAALGMPPEIVLRHRIPQFSHVFAGDSYSAGYYSYLWADTLSADAFEAFTEAKGPYDPEVARRLRTCVLSAGNTMDPAEEYRAFRGRDPGTAALMRKRAFAAPAAQTSDAPR